MFYNCLFFQCVHEDTHGHVLDNWARNQGFSWMLADLLTHLQAGVFFWLKGDLRCLSHTCPVPPGLSAHFHLPQQMKVLPPKNSMHFSTHLYQLFYISAQATHAILSATRAQKEHKSTPITQYSLTPMYNVLFI